MSNDDQTQTTAPMLKIYMALQGACPACGKSLRADPEWNAYRIACCHCGSESVISTDPPPPSTHWPAQRSTDMVETIGRAIAAAVREDYQEDWKKFDLCARYVLTAMREPTGDMKDAGAETFGVGNTAIGLLVKVLDGQPSKVWRAMIDAALGKTLTVEDGK